MSANLSLERIDYNRLMPRTCTVCSHRDREAIDQALVSGEPFRHIATRTGTSTAALQRHKHDHVPRSLAKAKEAQELAHADGLLDRVRWLCGRAEGFSRRRKRFSVRQEPKGIRDWPSLRFTPG